MILVDDLRLDAIYTEMKCIKDRTNGTDKKPLLDWKSRKLPQ